MYKVCIVPQYKHPDKADGGIRRIVEAKIRLLGQYGFKVVQDDREADILALHGTSVADRTDIPMVSHCHGMFWDTYEWGSWGHSANAQVVESLARAVAHTAPSIWVANAMRRGMMIYPRVIYHGVNAEEFVPTTTSNGYILWNKAREDAVSDSRPVNEIARIMPKRNFVTTFGKPTPNVRVVGSMPYESMIPYLSHASIYLATAQETFGIGTLEALASGLPVVGWDWGGQTEIIRQKETGFLVPRGDYASLASAIEYCYAHFADMSRAAREDVATRWGWEKRIEQYAELYTDTLMWWKAMKPKVSVVVTCYNLAKYLPDALASVERQNMTDFECIIVDDCSTDDTQRVAQEFSKRDKRFKYVRTPENSKLTGARNYGFLKSHGRYLQFLDADDMLAENALATLASELDKDASIHVASGHLDIVSEDGSGRKRCDFPPDEFNWFNQMAHYNQIPYSSMMRREVFERCGGYRNRCWRAEDAEFWCRATSLGFRAKKVTRSSMLIYRNRNDSKSKGEPGDGDWTAWFPWRLAGRPGELPYHVVASGTISKPKLTPFGAQGVLPGGKFWPVHIHNRPRVSVIIPVGAGHEKYVIDAIDSLVAQTMIDWEAIVVNDTGTEWPDDFTSPVAGAPFVTVVSTKGTTGASHARNVGARYAHASILCWLDADDYLLPTALEDMLLFYDQAGGDCIIYSDWLKNDSGELTPYATREFECGNVLEKLQHSVTCLVPTDAHRTIGGFDETFDGWEDWDYYIALQVTGICSFRVPKPLFVYRFKSGLRREHAFARKQELLNKVRLKYAPYYEGVKKMTCSGCGRKRKPKLPAAPPADATPQQIQAIASAPPETGMVLLEYNGKIAGPITFKGKGGRQYRFGQDPQHKRQWVHPEDAQIFLSRSSAGRPYFLKA